MSDPTKAENGTQTKAGTGENVQELKKQIELLQNSLNESRGEAEKFKAIKDKLVEEQNRKNKEHKDLLNSSASLEEKFKALNDSHSTLMEKFNSQNETLEELKTFSETARKKAEAELTGLMGHIPENKKTLIPPGYSVEQQLDFIKQNSAHFFDKATPAPVPVVPIANPKAPDKSPTVTLTHSEKQLIAGKISEEAAIGLKERDPDFLKNLINSK